MDAMYANAVDTALTNLSRSLSSLGYVGGVSELRYTATT
jgi:hypothetical protein